MGFKTAEFPPVDTSTFLHQPLRERIKALTLHWVEYGFGSPRMIAATYLVKIAVLWLLIGSIVITATSGVVGGSGRSTSVEPADRLPEGDHLDHAARSDRPRRIVGADGGQVQAHDRWHPVLGATGHDPATAVGLGAGYGR